MDLTGAATTLVADFARHAQEAALAAASRAAALSRRAVRGHRRRRVAPDRELLNTFAARGGVFPHVAHPRDRRALVDAHRRHRRWPHCRAGRIEESAPARTEGTLELFIQLVGGERPVADLDWL
jgi:hypothetical protein